MLVGGGGSSASGGATEITLQDILSELGTKLDEGGTVELGTDTLAAILVQLQTANAPIESALNDSLDSLADILLELDQKIEAGDIVGLDVATIAALQTISATILNQPTDFPDAASHTKLDAVNTNLTTIDGRVDQLETLITSTNAKLDSVIAAVDGLEAQSQFGTTAATSQPSVGTSSSTVLSSNVSRKQAIFVNASDNIIYIKFAATATTSDWSLKLLPNDTHIEDVHTGRVDAIASAASSTLNVTEVTS